MLVPKSKNLRALLALTLLCSSMSVAAADLHKVTVDLEDGRYKVVSVAWLDVSREELYKVLVDYDLFVKFSSSFVESRNQNPASTGKPGFYTRMEACVIWFCKSFERNGHLTLRPPSDISSLADPARSDFDYSHETWHLVTEGVGTLMTYTFDMDPSFWVPPVIGPFFMKRTLQRGGADAINRIEAVAQGREPEN